MMSPRDLAGFDEKALKIATKRAPTPQEMADLRVAWLCCKHVKSNAITIAKNGAVVGVGPSQQGGRDLLRRRCGRDRRETGSR